MKRTRNPWCWNRECVKYARCSALWNAGWVHIHTNDDAPHMCVVPSQSVCPSLQSTEKFKLLYHTRASSCNRHKNWLKNIVSFDANLTQTSEQKVQLHQNISLHLSFNNGRKVRTIHDCCVTIHFESIIMARNIQLVFLLALAIASVLDCAAIADDAAGFRPLLLIAGFCNLGLGALANVSLALFSAFGLGSAFCLCHGCLGLTALHWLKQCPCSAPLQLLIHMWRTFGIALPRLFSCRHDSTLAAQEARPLVLTVAAVGNMVLGCIFVSIFTVFWYARVAVAPSPSTSIVCGSTW